MLGFVQPAKRYFLTMFLVSCVLLAVLTLVIYQRSLLNEDSTRWVIHSYDILRHARSALADAIDSENAVQDYLASGNRKFLARYNQASAKLDNDLDFLSGMTSDNIRQQANLDSLRRQVKQFEQASENQIALFHKTHGRLFAPDVKPDNSRTALDALRASIGRFSNEESALLNQRIEAARVQQHNYMLTLFLGAVLDLGALVVASIFIFTLIARSSRVEEELRLSEERFRLLMHGINDGVFDRNFVSGKVYFSPACKTMLGYSERELPDTVEAFEALVHPDDVERLGQALARYANREVPLYSVVFRMRHKNGGWRWILSRAVGIRDETGKLLRMVGVRTDITEQKEREEELQQLNADLEGFTYIASHDLRAPLVNLQGFSAEMQNSIAHAKQLVERLKPHLSAAEQSALAQTFDKDFPEAIGFIRSSVEKMDKLTNAILDLSRIGRREYHLQIVDTEALVRRCLDALAYEINSRKIEVECSPLPTIISDSVALEQVFGNILDNAVKYLDPDRAGKISIQAFNAADQIIFSVKDNGRGIAEIEGNKVFDIFRRAGNAGDIRGAGMGMAYVKATLRKLGGRIWFRSSPGNGTVFYFSLPIQNVQSEAA